MNQDTLHQLVERWHEGETTLAEEQQLRQWFRDNKPDTPEMQQMAELFGYFEAEKAVVMHLRVDSTPLLASPTPTLPHREGADSAPPTSLESPFSSENNPINRESIETECDHVAKKTTTEPNRQAVAISLPMGEGRGGASQAQSMNKFSMWRIGLAASFIMLLCASGWWYTQQQQQAEQRRFAARERLYKDHYEDPQMALAEVKAALALVGKKMDKGKRTATKGLKQLPKLNIIR